MRAGKFFCRETRPRNWGLIGLLMLAFALRLYRVSDQELRGDEAFGYFFSRQSLPEMVRMTIKLGEPHPVGSYIIQNIWMNLGGDSELALRFPSLWAGTVAVALIYAVARAMGLGKEISTAALGLSAVAPYLIWHSQDARMYMLSLAFTLASTLIMWRWLRNFHTAMLVVYGALIWSALHIHYSCLYLWLAHNLFVAIYIFWHRKPSKKLAHWLLTQAAIFFLYFPWLRVALPLMQSYKGAVESPPIWEMVWRSFGVLLVGETTTLRERLVLAVLGGIWAAWGAWELIRKQSTWLWSAIWLLLALLLPLGITWVAALHRPLFNERYLVLGSSPFLILMAAGWVANYNNAVRWRRWSSYTIAVILASEVALSLYRMYYDPQYDKILGWRALAEIFRQLTSGVSPEQARLVITYPDPAIWYYYRGPVSHLVLPPRAKDEAAARDLAEQMALEGVRWVILAEYRSNAWDDRGIASAALAEHFTLAYETRVAIWPVRLYVRPVPEAWRQVNRNFAERLALEAIQIQPEQPMQGGLLVVFARWRREDAYSWPAQVYAFFHLVEEGGSLAPVVQCDPPLVPLPGQITWITVCGIPLPSDIPEGSYRLLAGVYERTGPSFPRWRTEEGLDSFPVWEGRIGSP